MSNDSCTERRTVFGHRLVHKDCLQRTSITTDHDYKESKYRLCEVCNIPSFYHLDVILRENKFLRVFYRASNEVVANRI